jgi:hypothetical protein
VSGGTFGRDDHARALPSRAQLLGWAAGAESQALGPDRSRLLQVGITDLAARASSGEARVCELTAELKQARRELTAWRSRVASELPAGCDYCGAPAGELCVSMLDGTPLVEAHTARKAKLQRQLGVAS